MYTVYKDKANKLNNLNIENNQLNNTIKELEEKNKSLNSVIKELVEKSDSDNNNKGDKKKKEYNNPFEAMDAYLKGELDEDNIKD